MGFRLAAVLASVCFVVGILFVCLTVDHKLLYSELTEQAVEEGFFFYTTFYNAPPVIKTLLHTVVGIGILSLMGKLHKWDDSAMFFDGSSLAAYVFAVGVYLTVSIPALRTIVNPFNTDTREDRVDAMRVLAAGNAIIAVLLGAVLCLQAGEVYARRLEAKLIPKVERTEESTASKAEKKQQ